MIGHQHKTALRLRKDDEQTIQNVWQEDVDCQRPAQVTRDFQNGPQLGLCRKLHAQRIGRAHRVDNRLATTAGRRIIFLNQRRLNQRWSMRHSDPVRLTNGTTGKLALTWKNLAPGSYIGRITFDGASSPTFVNVVVAERGAVGVAPASEDPKKMKEQGKVKNEDLTRSPDNSV